MTDEIEEANERARRGEFLVPSCPTCGSTRWVAREESTCTRYRVLFVLWDAATTGESEWDPTGHHYTNEALTCSNGHEPDEDLSTKVWDMLSKAPYDDEEEVTTEDKDAVDGGLELERSLHGTLADEIRAGEDFDAVDAQKKGF